MKTNFNKEDTQLHVGILGCGQINQAAHFIGTLKSRNVHLTAICDVATMIATFAIYGCDIHLDGPIHIRWGTTTTRETLRIAAHAAAALDLNTDFLLANQYYALAGPCTEMCLLETAAQAMTDTASGRELLSGVASAKGVMQDKTTGMEAFMMGEVAAATGGMEVSTVNEILDGLISLYENDYSRAPAGKRFQECYDVKSVKPNDEYLDIYDSAISKLNYLGLEL
jgi:methylamine--corrinoid protein Co-methyltransferase